MKELMSIFNDYKGRRKVAGYYVGISICMLFVLACSDSLIAVGIGAVNALNAIRVAKKYNL